MTLNPGCCDINSGPCKVLLLILFYDLLLKTIRSKWKLLWLQFYKWPLEPDISLYPKYYNGRLYSIYKTCLQYILPLKLQCEVCVRDEFSQVACLNYINSESYACLELWLSWVTASGYSTHTFFCQPQLHWPSTPLKNFGLILTLADFCAVWMDDRVTVNGLHAAPQKRCRWCHGAYINAVTQTMFQK